MKRKSSRREFLRGKSAADALADAIGPAPTDRDPQEPGGPYLVRVTRRAMACEFEVCLNAGQYAHGTQVALEALELVETLEQQMSVFRETSDLSRVNRSAAHGPVQLDQELFDLLSLALRLHGQTDGAFDVTSGPLSQVWGFARRAGAVPPDNELAEALKCVGSHLVELDGRQHSIRFRRPGVELNLGSIGKGYALDRCAERLLGQGISDFLLHGGNSSVLARGLRRHSQDDSSAETPSGWTVGLRHPLRPRRRLAEIRLCDRALATSGSWAQSFRHRGRRYGHVLDPRSGRPADEVLSATAVAPTAAIADALSTAFYVMGPQAVREYCRQRAEIAAVLVLPVRHSGGIEIETIGLADEEVTIL